MQTPFQAEDKLGRGSRRLGSSVLYVEADHEELARFCLRYSSSRALHRQWPAAYKYIYIIYVHRNSTTQLVVVATVDGTLTWKEHEFLSYRVDNATCLGSECMWGFVSSPQPLILLVLT